jgi:hypothetical protein
MSKYFQDFPDPANEDYYNRSDIEKWAKSHRTCWDMLNSQIDNFISEREKLIVRINELTEDLKKAEEGKR